MIFGIFGMVILSIGLDQYLKFLVLTHLKPIGSVPLWEGVFHLTYVENRGAAFGNLQGQQTFLIIVTSVVLLGLCWVLLAKKAPGKFLPWMIGLVIGGGVGNLIDRIFRGFVVDYLDFYLINFPVFNLADCCVVVGVFAIIGYLFIADRKEEKQADDQREEG